MGRKGSASVTGTTKQARGNTGAEKKTREKKPKMSPQEIEEKYGIRNKTLNYKINFKPLTDTQDIYYKMLREKQITFCTGVPGSGKSFVCLSAALKLLAEDNEYKRILIVSPTVEAGNMEIGFLKGSRDEKIAPYLEADYQTITDILQLNGNMSETILKDLIESKYIQGDCVNFMRGKTIKNTICIITEAENFNKQELWLLLSRVSPTSKYFINGDNRQQDRKDIKSNQQNGLKYAIDTLKDKIDKIGFCHFTKKDIVRDPIIEEIMNLWFEGENLDDEY